MKGKSEYLPVVRERKLIFCAGCGKSINYRGNGQGYDVQESGEERIVYDPENKPWHYSCLFLPRT